MTENIEWGGKDGVIGLQFGGATFFGNFLGVSHHTWCVIQASSHRCLCILLDEYQIDCDSRSYAEQFWAQSESLANLRQTYLGRVHAQVVY